MRKLLMLVLLASTAVPALAQSRERGEERSARAERNAEAEPAPPPEPRREREATVERAQPAPQARGERPRGGWNGQGRAVDPAAAARWEERRAQAIANGDQGQRRWGDRGPAATSPQAGTAPVVNAVPPTASPRQGWNGDRDGRWGNREGAVTGATVARGNGDDRRDHHSDGDRNSGWRGRDGRGQVGDNRSWNGDRDHGWNDRDRDHDRQRWSNDWRRDSRYDWQRYRNQNRFVFRIGTFYDPFGYGYRPLNVGYSLYSGYYQRNFWIDDPYQYRLPPAYGPYRWVRYYNDAVLVDIYSGEVVDVIRNFFW